MTSNSIYCCHYSICSYTHVEARSAAKYKSLDKCYTELSIQSGEKKKEKKRPGANRGSDHELLIAKFRLKLKKVGKTTRPFKYDLNQIPYDYTMEEANKFKGLDLVDRVPKELRMKVSNTVRKL